MEEANMFFRRVKPIELSFQNRLDAVKAAGFTLSGEGGGKARVSKFSCAAILEENGSEHPIVHKAGIEVGSEVGLMMNGGYQMFFTTPSGKKMPALAQHLKALHDFEEDLREALGMVSLYNVSLGTRADQHMYDRVKGRDNGTARTDWNLPPTPTP